LDGENVLNRQKLNCGLYSISLKFCTDFKHNTQNAIKVERTRSHAGLV